MRVPAWLRALLLCAVAVAVGAVVAGRFGATLVGGLALWGLGAAALPLVADRLLARLQQRRRRRRDFCARPPQQLR